MTDNETSTGYPGTRDLTQRTRTAPVTGTVTLEAPAVLLRDTPEDRERLRQAIEDQENDIGAWWPGSEEHADAIIAALRGEA